MIRALQDDEADRLIICPLRDHLYNEAQGRDRATHRDRGHQGRWRRRRGIGLIGQEKDATSYYLQDFRSGLC